MKNRSYKLPEYSPPSRLITDIIDDLKGLILLIEKIGVKVHNTRIFRYLKYLETHLKGGDESNILQGIKGQEYDSPQDRRVYVLREVDELIWIYKGLNICAPKGLKEKLKLIVCGRDVAALDKNTESRDTQYELRVASYFCQKGCAVDISKETDVIVKLGKDNIYIECKRVHGNNKRLIESYNEALKQLKNRMPKNSFKNKHYGIVAIDITKYTFSHNGMAFGVTSDAVKDHIQDGLKSASEILSTYSLPKFTILLWLQVHIATITQSPPSKATRFSNLWSYNDYLFPRNRRASGKVDSILASIKPDSRELPAEKLKPKLHTFPAGTVFHWNLSVFDPYVETLHLNEEDDNLEVLTVESEGKENLYYFYHLRMAVSHLSIEEKQKINTDRDYAAGRLAMEVIAIAEPYENTF